GAGADVDPVADVQTQARADVQQEVSVGGPHHTFVAVIVDAQNCAIGERATQEVPVDGFDRADELHVGQDVPDNLVQAATIDPHVAGLAGRAAEGDPHRGLKLGVEVRGQLERPDQGGLQCHVAGAQFVAAGAGGQVRGELKSKLDQI